MKLIKDYPNYRIHKTGLVETCIERGSNRPTDTWRELKQVYDKACGYMLVTLCDNGKKKNKRIHRLLCEHFLTNPKSKHHVNHIDGNKLNNSLANLEWATPQENAIHACRTGLCDARRKAQEITIVQYTKDGLFIAEHTSIHEAGRASHVAYQNISKVIKGVRKTAGGYKWEYKKSSETIEKQSKD